MFYLKYALIPILALFLLQGCEEERNTEPVEVVEAVEIWKVPFDDTRTRDPFVSPTDGRVYFAGQREHYIGYFDIETEEFGYFELEDGAGPHTVVVADNGTLWYAGNRARHIGKIDPNTGEITKYMMDNDYARDPHTFAFDKDGNIWFSAQGGNGVGHFNVSTGEARVVAMNTPNSRPYGVRMAPDGIQPWISMNGTNKIVTVNPETMGVTDIILPNERTVVRRLDVTSDGMVWYGDFNSGNIGRYNPNDGTITEWEMPDGDGSRPYAVLADDKDRVWFSASGLNPNKLVAFDTKTEEFVASVEIEEARGAIRHTMFDVNTRSFWFGTDTGHIGRLILN